MADDLIEVTLDRFVYGGEVMGRLPDGRAVFIPHAIAGEQALIRIIEQKKHYARGELVTLVEASKDRIEPRCVHFGECSGCHYQHTAHSHQQQIKETILREQWQRIANVDDLPMMPIAAASQEWNYHNTLAFQLDPKGLPGFNRYRSEKVFGVQECHLPEAELEILWRCLDVGSDSGISRVLLRQGQDDDVLLALEGSAEIPPEFAVDFPISVVYTGPEGEVVLSGDNKINLSIKDRSFQVSANVYFPVNTLQAAKIVDFLLDNLELHQNLSVLNLHCGGGWLSAFIAPRVGQVIGVDETISAGEDFVYNMDEFENVSLYLGSAEDILPGVLDSVELLIVEPSESGLTIEVLDLIATHGPLDLVYISCDPATLARDAKKLFDADYHLEKVLLVDMRPQTGYIDSVNLFRIKAE
jgi:23S rRNA (uracil1939-C5)-methyltransferase